MKNPITYLSMNSNRYFFTTLDMSILFKKILNGTFIELFVFEIFPSVRLSMTGSKVSIPI